MIPEFLKIDLLKELARGNEWVCKKRVDARPNQLKPDYEGGEIIFRQGELGQELIVLERGMIEVSIASYRQLYMEGFDKVPRMIVEVSGTPGTIYGELSTFAEIPRSATLTAIGPTKIRIIEKDALLNTMRSKPDLGISIATSLANKLLGTNHKICRHMSTECQLIRVKSTEFAETYVTMVKAVYGQYQKTRKMEFLMMYKFMERSPLRVYHGQLRRNKEWEQDGGQPRTKVPESAIQPSPDLTLHIKRDEFLIRQGESGRDLYIVSRGMAGIFLQGEQVASLGPGSVIGEASALTTHAAPQRTADIKALTDMTLLRVPFEGVRAYLQQNPEFTFSLCEALVRRVLFGNNLLGNAQNLVDQYVRSLNVYLREFTKAGDEMRRLNIHEDLSFHRDQITAASRQISDLRDDFIRSQNILYRESVMDYTADLLSKLSTTNREYLQKEKGRIQALCSKLGYATLDDFVLARIESLEKKRQTLQPTAGMPSPITFVDEEIAHLRRFQSSAND